MTSNISLGFLEDCHLFMQRFANLNSINFQDFCTTWNDLNFHCIFYGRQSVDDLNNFVEEALTIVKRIFVRSSNMNDKCCCLYLMYSIYQKQPDKGVAKIRVTENDWSAFKDFYSKLSSEEYQHPFIIWWKLLQDDAYHFCLFESKYLLDGQSKSENDKTESGIETQLQYKPISASILHEVEGLQTNHGIMSALEALEIAYNEMKENLDQPEEGECTLAPSTLVKDINEALQEMQDLFTHSRPQRAKRKRTRRTTETSRKDSDEEVEREKGERKSIKDKRKSIKDRAFKEIKKERGSVTDSEKPSCSSQEESPVKSTKSKTIVDQIHFKKITEVQKIFEMNCLESDSTQSDALPSPSPKKKPKSAKK
ncbi:snRNA-activating protein complex subunit 1 [Culicoides brevitarsis]|uniref:snRNA-activating protein complex subunit 1 n=1 Tax=Culicoides brevitarsis TaxID=469753 RepID=UPI00307BCCA0